MTYIFDIFAFKVVCVKLKSIIIASCKTAKYSEKSGGKTYKIDIKNQEKMSPIRGKP